MTDIVPVSAVALDQHSEPEALVLARCEQASVQLRETHDLDEGRNILAAMSTLEHAVKARDLNADSVLTASAMRVRAERRVGQLIAQEREAGRMAPGGHGGSRPGAGRPHLQAVPQSSTPRELDSRPDTLADVGISKKQAADYGRMADVPDHEFEQALGEVTDEARVTGGAGVRRSAVMRKVAPEQQKGPDGRWADCDRWIERCRQLAAESETVIATMRFGQYPGSERGLILSAVEQHIDAALVALTEAKQALQQGARNGKK